MKIKNIYFMRTAEKAKYFYEFLPRFVTDLPGTENERRLLPVIERRVERDGVLFDFMIMPASVLIEGNKNKYFYPSEMEELVEKALRILAVKHNPSFSEQEYILGFSLTQLISALVKNNGQILFDKSRIELSLNILSNVEYQLSKDGRVVIFRPINGLFTEEKNGEVYYELRFSPIFFNNVQILNMCFGTQNLF